jgi:hypothetical protein
MPRSVRPYAPPANPQFCQGNPRPSRKDATTFTCRSPAGPTHHCRRWQMSRIASVVMVRQWRRQGPACAASEPKRPVTVPDVARDRDSLAGRRTARGFLLPPEVATRSQELCTLPVTMVHTPLSHRSRSLPRLAPPIRAQRRPDEEISSSSLRCRRLFPIWMASRGMPGPSWESQDSEKKRLAVSVAQDNCPLAPRRSSATDGWQPAGP